MGQGLITCQVDAGDLATTANNALAFLPARSAVKVARVHIGPERFTVTATDTYAVGVAHCATSDYKGPESGLAFDIPRDALTELDKAGRTKENKGFANLVYYPNDGLVFSGNPEGPYATAAIQDVSNRDGLKPDGLWPAVDALMERLERREPTIPGYIAFDPTLLMRFSKVKADKAERVMDCYMSDRQEPILVKIGVFFTGCLMPIDRADHGAKIGEEGLWTE